MSRDFEANIGEKLFKSKLVWDYYFIAGILVVLLGIYNMIFGRKSRPTDDAKLK